MIKSSPDEKVSITGLGQPPLLQILSNQQSIQQEPSFISESTECYNE